MKKALIAVSVLAVLLSALPASAYLAFKESTDAGATLATAAVLSDGTAYVTGSINSSTDKVDLYKFNWGGGAFYVNTVSTAFDSKLYLFDSTGHGVQANDDGFGTLSRPSYIQRPSSVYDYNSSTYIPVGNLDAGTYYLAICGTGYSPYSGSSSYTLFPNINATKQIGPKNSTYTLSGWTGSSTTGAYYINFTQASNGASGRGAIISGTENPTGSPTPIPPAVFLFGSGLSGLLLCKSRKTGR